MAKKISKYRFNYSFLFWLIFSTLTFIFFPGNNSFASTQVVLEWTPNSEDDLAGYKVFCREESQSFDYSNPSWKGTENYCTIYNLDETKTYCFVARAYDTEGFESGDSDEVCHIPTVIPEDQPPIAEVTIEAEDMSIKTTGGPTTDGWNIWSNGYIADDVDFPTGGTYTFEVRAKGSYAGGDWPIMEVRIDQTAVETFTVDSSNWIVYTIEAYVTSGTHEIAIAFTNDYYNTPEDRNLYVDKITTTQAVDNRSPEASISSNVTSGIAPLSATFGGSGSYDPDGTVVSYDWDFGDDTTDSGETVSHTFNDSGVYTVTLTVTDNQGATGSDTIQITATQAGDNKAPTADAGPDQTADEGQVITLNGSNSTDSDDGIASYHWNQKGGLQVILSAPDSQQTTFTAPEVGVEGSALTFELTVVDHSGAQNTNGCVVNVTWQNETPEANAGTDQTVNEGIVVNLDGSSSLDIDDGIVAYLWTQISGPLVTLSDPASSQPTFTPPNVGPEGASLTFILTVTDMGGLQDTDSSIVNISWQNETPIAVVTPDYMEPIEGTLVTLDGASSMDPDDGIVSRLWTQVDGDPVSISDPTSAVTTFTAPKTDQHGKNLKFKLTVKDSGGLQDTADCLIYVVPTINEPAAPTNNPPAADYSFSVKRKSATFIDNSNDTDGTIVSWFWNFGDGNTSTERNPKHRYNKFRSYSVSLTVTDEDGASSSTSKNITIKK